MARSDIDSFSLVREPVDLDELAAEALAQAGVLAARQGVRLGEPPGRTGRHVVAGDPLRLSQLLGVLLDNATRYSRAGDRVDILIEAEPTELRVTVRDQGIGIPVHELPQVFDRHFRGALARRHSPDGSGLGLSIARSLARAHGGQLELHSNADGTRAVLTLPRLAALPQDIA